MLKWVLLTCETCKKGLTREQSPMSVRCGFCSQLLFLQGWGKEVGEEKGVTLFLSELGFICFF